jgi:ParB-like chromosome segregation protein Spo0J
LIRETTMAVRKTAAAKEVSLKANKEGITFVAVDKIEVEKGFNLRGDKIKADQSLIDSVKANGVKNPLHVRWKNKKRDGLHLVDGARRLDAAIKAELGSVPVQNHGFLSDTEALIISMTVNENQNKFTKSQKIKGFKKLKRAGLDVEEIAHIMAVDKRTVSEALRVEEKAAKELKAAARKPSSKGGVSTRVAARAASLPKEEQEKIVKKVAGKSTQAGMREVRKTEIRLGKKHTGKRSRQEFVNETGYKLADDALERVMFMENELKRLLRHAPSHRLYNAQMDIIRVIKGKMLATDLWAWDKV